MTQEELDHARLSVSGKIKDGTYGGGYWEENGKEVATDLLAHIDILQAKLNQHAAWAAERIEMNEQKGTARHAEG